MAKGSKILQKDHESAALLSERMTPEERLIAYFYHSQLLSEIYRAGVNYRTNLPSVKRISKER